MNALIRAVLAAFASARPDAGRAAPILDPSLDHLPAAVRRELFGEAPQDPPSGRPARPFSFRMHPITELSEWRDRSALASLP